MTYRVAIIGLSHDHVWNEVPHWLAHPDADLIAVCDANESLHRRADEEWGVETAFTNVDELFDATYPDICLLFGSNREAAEIAPRALRRQIHVMIEKPLAHNLAAAEELQRVARGSQAELMVNWPEWWYPSYQIAETILRREAIGPLRSARIRMGHRGPREIGCSAAFCKWLYDGEQNGAGAFLDYGCYGAAASLHILGRPLDVSATLFHHPSESVDLEASMTLRYDEGLAHCEASWRQEPPTREHTFFGAFGTVWLDKENLWVQTVDSERIHLQPQAGDVPFNNAAQYMIHHLEEQKPIDGIFGLDINVDTMSILDAGLRSAAAGHRVEPRWV